MTETTPIDHSKDAEPKTPQLAELVGSALKLFHSRHTSTHNGNYFGYSISEASRDAVSQSGFTPPELYAALTAQTQFSAREIIDYSPDSADTFEEVLTNISSTIVNRELTKAHPEIKEQDSIRLEWESKSYAKWRSENL